MLALPYEQFRSDPRSFVERLAEFAGRPLAAEQLDALPYESKANPGPPATAIAARRWLNTLGVRTDLNPAPPLASPRFWKLGKRIDRLSLAPQRAVTHEEEKLRRLVSERVADRYVESNRRTAEVTGLDLGAYGWMI